MKLNASMVAGSPQLEMGKSSRTMGGGGLTKNVALDIPGTICGSGQLPMDSNQFLSVENTRSTPLVRIS